MKLLRQLSHAWWCLLLCCSTAALAQESILSFHSDITIAADASMIVTETIRVRAQGDQIRRGIYRDFPTDYKDQLGNRHIVGFEVLEIRRDGLVASWNQEHRSNGVRVYIMDPQILLQPGEYEFDIRYRTTRQLGFFDDHDELYWNVTGNGWAFPIEQASASVRLPQAVPEQDLQMEGYTGRAGSKAQDYSVSLAPGQGSIAASVPLPAGSGLTLVFSFPKDIVTAPTAREQSLYVLSDNRGLLLALLALLGSAAYLFLMWSRYGRDPAAGVIFPHYEPPENISPAAARYLRRMSYDNQAFTAAIVNLAVKGYLTIEHKTSRLGEVLSSLLNTQASGTFELHQGQSDAALAAGEQAILDPLFSKDTVVELQQKNQQLLRKCIAAHRSALKQAYQGRYFKSNTRLLLPSMLGVLAIFILTLLLQVFVPLAIIFYLLIIVMHLVFAWLMKAPSEQGRAVLDKLEGFKEYLEVAEKQDLQIKNPPQLTPQLFERMLPFAIALGVEQAWAKKFTQVFAGLQASSGTAYHPLWYAGSFNHNDLSGFTSNVSSAFNNAIASASTPPGSASGGGGGGSSGGGGGGGGGGGC